jgi:hypothetical protein
MVLDIAFNILAPDDWVVVPRSELPCNIFSPRFHSSEPLLAEDSRHVSLYGNDGGSSKVVAEDTKRGDCLPFVLVLEGYR